MSQIFCFNCGAKHQYNFSKPKFCSSCGTSLDLTSTPPKKSGREEDYYDEEEDHDGNTNIQRVPNIRNLQVEIESESEVNQFTLGSIFNNKSAPQKRSRRSNKSLDDFINTKSRGGE